MPLYSYKCPLCGKERSDMRTIDARHDAPVCDKLGHGRMQLQIGATAGIVKNPAVPRGKP